MNFVFVSECEKKAHCRTRRVLDAFCVRIGSYTWLANLTQEGLDALHLNLKKTASKNTAVACHHISKSTHKLLFIVGNKSKFNSDGYVPINYTEMETKLTKEDEK